MIRVPEENLKNAKEIYGKMIDNYLKKNGGKKSKLKKLESIGISEECVNKILYFNPSKDSLDNLNSCVEEGENNAIPNRYKILQSVFNYEALSKSTKSPNLVDLSEAFGMPVCPYCNEMPTYVIKKGDKKRVRPSFDHFYPKSKYPYLAISFCNLIPCCSVCNSSLKGDSDFSIDSHLHPFFDSMHDYHRFSYIPKNVDFVFEAEDFSINIKRKNNSKYEENIYKRSENNISSFALGDRYNHHRYLALELIRKSYIYNEGVINDLHKSFEKIFSSRKELQDTIIGSYLREEDFSKKPLAKFSFDIAEELGLIFED